MMKHKYLKRTAKGIAAFGFCGMVGGLGGVVYSGFARPNIEDAPQQRRLDELSDQRQSLDEQLLACVLQDGGVPDDCLAALRQYVNLGQEAVDIRASADYKQLSGEIEPYNTIGILSWWTVIAGMVLGYGVSISLLAYVKGHRDYAAESRLLKEYWEERHKANLKPSGDKAP